MDDKQIADAVRAIVAQIKPETKVDDFVSQLQRSARKLEWFKRQQPYVEQFFIEGEPFDELDGDELPDAKVIFNVMGTWADLAIWRFNNPEPK